MQLVVRVAYVRLWWMHAQNLERRGVVAPFVLAFLCPFHYFDLLTVIAAMRVCVLVRFCRRSSDYIAFELLKVPLLHHNIKKTCIYIQLLLYIYEYPINCAVLCTYDFCCCCCTFIAHVRMYSQRKQPSFKGAKCNAVACALDW